jgi:nicotinamide riboside transporter PnuC
VIDQAIIGVCGVTAIFLSQDPAPSRRRWACVFGLCAQPAWFYTTWQAEQYGIFCLSLFYAYAWARGVRTYWLRPQGEPSNG